MSTAPAAWALALPVALPLAGALIAPLLPRRHAALAIATGTLVFVATLALLHQIVTGGPLQMALGGWEVPLGIKWRADLVAAAFLLTTAVTALTVAAFAAGSLPGTLHEPERFWSPFLLLWASLNVLFLSGDAFNLYVALELLTLAAVVLVTLEGNAAALEGAMRYLLVALAGSTVYLLGVAFLYHASGTLDLALAARTPGAAGGFGLALMTVGLMAKGAFFPLHVWLPPAHAAAPAPGSALLSGLVVTGAFYILLRLWMEGAPEAAAARQLLGLCGVGALLWGSLLALRQARLKLVVAYSTVAQLGYLLLLFPLAIGPWTAAAYAGAIWLALAHGLAKAAMFLAAGLVMHTLGHDRVAELRGLAHHAPLTIFTIGLAGITLTGLPPSGAFLAKWLLLQAALGSGQWIYAVFLLGGGLLAAGYTFRVLAATFGAAPAAARPVPRRLEWMAFALAGASVLLGLSGAVPLAALQAAAP